MIIGDSGGGLVGTFLSRPHSAAGNRGSGAELWLVCTLTQTRSIDCLGLLVSILVSIGQEGTERNSVCPQRLRILWLWCPLWCILNSRKLFLILKVLGNTSVFTFKKSETSQHIPELLEKSHPFLSPSTFSSNCLDPEVPNVSLPSYPFCSLLKISQSPVPQHWCLKGIE